MFDPISWALGFGATQATKALLDRLFPKDLRRKLGEVSREWADSLPDQISTSPEAIMAAEPSGPARERLQARLYLHKQAPTEAEWSEALIEAWEHKRMLLGDDANPFLRQDRNNAVIHLRNLAQALARTCAQEADLFHVSALNHLEEIASQAKSIHQDLFITQSLILEKLDGLTFSPPRVNQRAICNLLERPHHCDGNGLLELNALILADRPSVPLGGHIRRNVSWVGTKGSPIEEATYVPPAPFNIVRLFAEFVDRWSRKTSQFESRDSDVVYTAMAQFHHELVSLHPFEDGNGSVARVLTDYQASHLFHFNTGLKLKYDQGYPAALKAADSGNLEPFVGMIASRIMAG